MAKNEKGAVKKRSLAPLTPRDLAVETVTVDYPQQDEVIASADYAIRVGAPGGASQVEISLNQGPWQPCREAAGYWWYDWSGYSNGEHEVVARCLDSSGRLLRGEPHEFFVTR